MSEFTQLKQCTIEYLNIQRKEIEMEIISRRP